MPSEYPLRAVMGSIQRQMLEDFEVSTAQIEHRGAKGREREALVLKNYLDRYLPGGVVPAHGVEIVDSEGGRSSEVDLAIIDHSTPPIYGGESFQIIPAEWTHGVVEVKSRLDATELRDACGKVRHAKSLAKTAYRDQQGDIARWIDCYGARYDFFPTYGIVFAYTSTGLPGLAKVLWDAQQGTPHQQWVDAVVVLDGGVLLYSDPSGTKKVTTRPSPGCELWAIKSDEALVPATLMFQRAFESVWMRPALLAPYFGSDIWGTVVDVLGY